MPRDLSHMPGDLSRRVSKIDKAIDKSRKDSLREAGRVAKDAQIDTMRLDAGGDLRLSRVRSGRGAKIGARYDLTPTGATIKATGPVPLLANRTKAHRIPKAGRRRKVLAIPRFGVFASANHPGTPGKDTWNKGRERAQPKIKTVIARNTDDAVKRAFLSGG